MGQDKVNCSKRNFLIAATSAVGGAAIVATSIPFVAGMMPSQRARAAGAPVEVDVSKIEPGTILGVEWRGKPVWILNRTDEMLERMTKIDSMLTDPQSEVPQQPGYCKNATRSIKSNLLVVVGICTHLGCAPSQKVKSGVEEGMGADWPGGFFCPCHGSRFDLAGRVFNDSPAPTNLVVPPHKYLSDSQILVGDDSKGT